MDKTQHLFPIEREAIKWLLAGDHTALEILRNQACITHVKEREFSTAGSYTHFETYGIQPLQVNRRLILSSLDVKSPQCPKAGFGAILFIESGLLSVLEMFTYADDFIHPAEIDVEACTFSYTYKRKNDLLALDTIDIV